MKTRYLAAILAATLAAGCASAAPPPPNSNVDVVVDLAWDNATQNTDGTPISDVTITRVGREATDGTGWVVVGEVGWPTNTITGVIQGSGTLRYYAQHVTSTGTESDWSTPVDVTNPRKVPRRPDNANASSRKK